MSKETFEEWAILELMGHRRLAGLVKEQTIGGSSFIRLDVPGIGPGFKATQFYNPAAVYCITPTTEVIARKIAEKDSPTPAVQWELEDRTVIKNQEISVGFGFEEDQE